MGWKMMLEVQGLDVGYGGRIVLREVSFDVRPGEILALIGPNGAGKTTLVNAISGVLPARSGIIRVEGQDLSCLSAARRASYLAVVPQARICLLISPCGKRYFSDAPYLGWLEISDRDRGA
jgi:ABC-type cobalamin/Fe3+-siderophores transport system ATPase subunit